MLIKWQFITAPSERFPTCHAANLALLPNGQLAVVYFAGSREGAGDSANVLQRLQADGTWSPQEVVQYTAGKSAGNAVLMPLPDGRTILFYTLSYSRAAVTWADALVHYRFSGDNGLTWGAQFTISEEYGYICRQPALILGNGEWLLPLYDNRGGNLERFPGMGGNEGCVAVSGDGGRHWERFGRMTTDAGLAQPCIVDLGSGHLRAWLRTRNYWNGHNPEWAYLYRCDSLDNGRNWSQPARTLLPNNNSSFQVRRLQDRALVLAYNHQGGRMRSPLNVALSYDDGDTWVTSKELEPFDADGAEYSYPAVQQTSDGLIHIAYTYRRMHIKHVVCDREWLAAP